MKSIRRRQAWGNTSQQLKNVICCRVYSLFHSTHSNSVVNSGMQYIINQEGRGIPWSAIIMCAKPLRNRERDRTRKVWTYCTYGHTQIVCALSLTQVKNRYDKEYYQLTWDAVGLWLYCSKGHRGEREKERDIAAIRAHSDHLCMSAIMQTLTHRLACTKTFVLCMYTETLKNPWQTIHLPPLLIEKWIGGIGSVVLDPPRHTSI